MRDDKEVVEGKIVSTQLGEFGNTGIIYGYISVDDPAGKNIVVKIDSYTEHSGIDIGDYVIIDAAKLGMTEIRVAKKITHRHELDSSAREEAMSAH